MHADGKFGDPGTDTRMSGWGPPPGGQGGWGGPPQQPDPYGQQPQAGAPQQDPYGGAPQQAPYGSGPQQDPYGQQPAWGQSQPQAPYGQPGAYGQQPQGYGQPAPAGPGYPGAPQKKRNSGLIIGIAGGAFGVIAIIVIVVVLISNMGGGDTKITTPESAGGLTRDHSAESQIPDIATQKDQLKRMAKGDIKEVLTAVYASSSPGASAEADGKVFFLGATASSEIDQDGFIEGFKKGLGSAAKVQTVSAGSKGGQAVCATASSTPVCLWVDGSTFGEIVPTGKSQTEAAALMLKMRDSIEVEAGE